MSIKYAEKLNKIEKEPLKIKKSYSPKKIISLKGVLKGVKISEKDIKQAKNKIFIAGVLSRFENIAKKGRRFARKKGIKKSDL